jgi:hypothetical protein
LPALKPQSQNTTKSLNYKGVLMLVQTAPTIETTNTQPNSRAVKSRQIGILMRGFLQATALICLLACEDSMVGSLRTDAEIVNHEIGGIKLAIPVNYLDSYSKGSAFMIASWPEMEGRTRDNYLHYTQSNLGMLVQGAADYKTSLRYLAVDYKIYAHDPSTRAPAPKRVGSIYGFEHYEAFGNGNPSFEKKMNSYEDIYVRKTPSGDMHAFIVCDGIPAPSNMDPQCSLRLVFPELPTMLFKISFSRRDALDHVNEIEAKVLAKFLEFKSAADANATNARGQ